LVRCSLLVSPSRRASRGFADRERRCTGRGCLRADSGHWWSYRVVPMELAVAIARVPRPVSRWGRHAARAAASHAAPRRRHCQNYAQVITRSWRARPPNDDLDDRANGKKEFNGGRPFDLPLYRACRRPAFSVLSPQDLRGRGGRGGRSHDVLLDRCSW
jgi:hypothetical protein